MSALAVDPPGSVQRETKLEPEPQMKNSPEQDIANLAYTLWQQRGCPCASPEQDWFEAEERMHASQKL
jgi:hypothetical protein